MARIMKTLTAGEDGDKVFFKPAEPVFKCHICVVLKAERRCDNVDFKLSWKRPIGQPHFLATGLPAISSLKEWCEIHIFPGKSWKQVCCSFCSPHANPYNRCSSAWLFFCLIIQLNMSWHWEEDMVLRDWCVMWRTSVKPHLTDINISYRVL